MTSIKTARRAWYVLSVLSMFEATSISAVAPYTDGGANIGELHALSCFVAGAGVAALLLARTEPGNALSTKASRYMFALMGGLAFDVIVTWALWAVGFPIVNGTVRRGLMAENYWLGPAILAYTVIVWFGYRAGLIREARAGES